MRRIAVAVVVAGAAAACGSAQPSAPSPPVVPAAVLSATGPLTFTACVTTATSDVVACQFAGTAQNAGPGCASGVSGQTFSFRPNSNVALDTKSWSYGAMVRPGATFSYGGDALLVPAAAAGTYATTFAFTSVACP
jgi:hypothetical protein